MNAFTAGALLALLVVGYPLYQLVTTGGLDVTTALLRGGVVAVACTAGVTLLARVALGWEKETHREREHRLNSLFSSMEDAVANGRLTDESADQEASPSGESPR